MIWRLEVKLSECWRPDQGHRRQLSSQGSAYEQYSTGGPSLRRMGACRRRGGPAGLRFLEGWKQIVFSDELFPPPNPQNDVIWAWGVQEVEQVPVPKFVCARHVKNGFSTGWGKASYCSSDAGTAHRKKSSFLEQDNVAS